MRSELLGGIVTIALAQAGWAPTAARSQPIVLPEAEDAPPVVEPGTPPALSGGALRADAVCTADGWCAEHPRPFLGAFNDTWIPSPHDGFAVGDGGIFARRVADPEPRWLFGHGGVGADLNGVFGAGAEVYAVGDGGTLLKWTREGWVREQVPTKESLLSLWLDDERLVVVGVRGTALRHQGGAWEALEVPGVRGNLDVVWGAGRELWMGDSDGRVHHFDGTTWREPSAITGGWVFGLHGDGQEIFAAGHDKALARWSDAAWKVDRSLGARAWRDVFRLGPGRAFAVGDAGFVAEHRDGRWWRGAASPGDLRALAGSSDEDVVAVGSAIVAFDGERWQRQVEPGPPPSARALWGVGDTLYAAAEGNVLCREAGRWQVVHSSRSGVDAGLAGTRGLAALGGPPPGGASGVMTGIWASSPEHVVAVGMHRYLARFDGKEWHEVTSTTVPSLQAVWGPGADLAWAPAHQRVSTTISRPGSTTSTSTSARTT